MHPLNSKRRVSQIYFALGALVIFAGANSAACEELEEVIVSGDRDLLSQDLMPTFSVQALDSTTRVSQDRTIADWLAGDPSMSLNGQGGLLQSYSIRGMSRSRVRTEIDGVPIITDRAAGNSASFLPPALISAVAVQKGGSSAFYGSDAMGGVVNLQTRRFTQLEVEGIFQNRDNAFALTMGGAPRDDTYVGMTVRRADEASAAESMPLNTGYRQGAAALRHERSWQALKLRLSGLLSRGEDIGKSDRDYPGSKSLYPHERHGVLKLELERPNRWLLRLYGHGQDWQSQTQPQTQTGTYSHALNTYQSDTLGSLFYFTHSRLGGLGRAGIEWVGRRGVSIRYQEKNSAGVLVTDSEPVSGHQDNLGLFIDQQWTTGPLDAGLGFRFDHVSQAALAEMQSHSVLSASARLNWHMTEQATLFARWASGFRAPTLSELYYRGITPRGEIVGNNELEPEESVSTELGFELKRDHFSLSLNGYRTDIDRYIERFDKTVTTRSYRNIGEGIIRGYEFRVVLNPSQRWAHAISYGYQSGRESATDDWLADLNPSKWRYGLTWRPSRVSVRLDLSHREGRSEFGPGEAPLSSATLLNVAVSRSFGRQWEWRIACTNCSNQRFYGSADERAAWQPGRAVAVNFSWKR
jgi:outer membrane receptor protein involved in Fe transport